jgi:hypothetical protein
MWPVRDNNLCCEGSRTPQNTQHDLVQGINARKPNARKNAQTKRAQKCANQTRAKTRKPNTRKNA